MSPRFRYQRRYCGGIQAVILDWAGTTIDHGCMAPAVVFQGVFEAEGVPITIAVAREPMGSDKRTHIQRITELPSVRDRWTERHGRPPGDADVDRMFAAFVPAQLACLAEHSELIDGTLEAVADARRRGAKIGSTTGYNTEMMAVNLREARRRGYEPDAMVCASDVPRGRPYPFMCLQNAILLGVECVESAVKVDDTRPGIDEGLNAGMWTVGLAMSGNEIGLTRADLDALDADRRARLRAAAYDRLARQGAHYVIDSIAELPAVLDDIEARLRRGERP